VRLTGPVQASDTSFTTELANAVGHAVAGKRRGDGTSKFG
jgi:hypothetical protein